jgi:predicted SAM-dependent methyltransferase|tara:strand:+ start:45 stop:590 length:546 start_codon:yes stop_codon:yes gene_type:complete
MKLHLGCGKRYLKGFVHVDLADFEHIDYKLPVQDLSVFKDESVVEIYASHVLEYFDPKEVGEVLTEWNRVLKKGGVLRIAVPNFSELINVYKNTNNLQNILGPLYGRWEITKGENIYHKTVYDEKSLTSVLKDANFRNITRWDWREVFANQDNFDDHSQAYFPHMQKEDGIHVSLNLECIK